MNKSSGPRLMPWGMPQVMGLVFDLVYEFEHFDSDYLGNF